MAQLTIPIMIWAGATSDERDQFYLDAGFDPNLPVFDDGSDNQFVRRRQDPAPVSVTSDVIQFSNHQPQAGDDMRDFEVSKAVLRTSEPFTEPPVGDPSPGAIVAVSSLGARLPALIRPQFLGWVGGLTVGARLTFASLPWWLRQALTGLGLTGVTIAVDEALEAAGLPSLPGSFIGPQIEGQTIPGINVAPAQSQIVGSWVANGVRFYRLMDGKLAVQNKRGRWKVWRPKKPIVLYASGASNLKTMLRADKALNKQAKQIAAMLNRRARPRRQSSKSDPSVIIQGRNARVIDV